MASKASRFLRWSGVLGAFLLLPLISLAQGSGTGEQTGGPGGVQATESGPNLSSKLDVAVQDDNGGDLLLLAVVTLSTVEGKMHKQANAEAGHAVFEDLAPGRYTIQVTAQGYDSAKQTITVAGPHLIANVRLHRKPNEDMEQAGFSGLGGSGGDLYGMTTAVAEQRQILKISQALRDNKPQKARMDLEKLYLDRSTEPTLNYLYGEYYKEMKDLPKAKLYWQRTVAVDAKNLGALMELGQTALDEGKPAEALPYLKRAAQASPTTWHPHALMVVAYSKLKQYPQAVEEAERALDLGHAQAAAVVQPALASSLAAEGNKEQAIQILRDYTQEHPDAEDAKNLLTALTQPFEAPWPAANLSDPSASAFDFDPMLPSAWIPSNVDDKVPPVEPGVPCSLDTVLSKASKRMTELV